jgi:hypothetical protein
MKKQPKNPIPSSQHPHSYIKAYEDIKLLKHDIMRPVRMELETLKPEVYLRHFDVKETIVCFGSARVRESKEAAALIKSAEAELKKHPQDKKLKARLEDLKGLARLSKYYDEARKFGQLVIKKAGKRFSIVTGGGPGLMEAANRGAFETGGRSIGMNITLPHEQKPNPYITRDLAFLFHYFAIRKLHLVLRSRACVVFPGGYGTFDELFELLTLVKTGKKKKIPIILVGKEFWNDVLNLKALAGYGVISKEELKAYTLVETAQEAWDIIAKFYKIK